MIKVRNLYMLMGGTQKVHLHDINTRESYEGRIQESPEKFRLRNIEYIYNSLDAFGKPMLKIFVSEDKEND